jgi:uroporphyrinogen-III decarboxylase
MPTGGYFFDTIIRQEPVREDKLDPKDNLEEFSPVSEQDLSHFRASVLKEANTGRGVISTFGGTAFGDIALVPAPFLKHPRGIRDISEWYISTATRKDYIHEVFSSQCDIALGNLVKIHKTVGNQIDAVFICGTDFGTQTSRFCSIETFNDLWFPYYRRVNEWIHRNTTWKTFKHSCGAIEPLLDRFIAAGFDIINPVQCSATGMDPEKLKAHYGDRLVFWGGGVDTQWILPFGTPDEVRKQVLERCRIFSPGGGFVFDSIHNVQALTPAQNIIAMLNAVHEFNGNRT